MPEARPALCVVMASGGYPGPYKKGYPIEGLDDVAGMIRLRIRLLLFIVAGVCLSVVFFTRFEKTAEFRFDTGDVRLRFMGVTYQYYRLAPQEREAVHFITMLEPTIERDWRGMDEEIAYTCQHWYSQIVAWLDVDPRIARIAMEDVIAWVGAIERPDENVRYGSPLLHHPLYRRGPHGRWQLVDEWSMDKEVVEYLSRRGYYMERSRGAYR